MNISKSVTWHRSVIDNSGKTTKEYRTHRTQQTDGALTKRVHQDVQQRIAIQNYIYQQNNANLNTLNNKKDK